MLQPLQANCYASKQGITHHLRDHTQREPKQNKIQTNKLKMK